MFGAEILVIVFVIATVLFGVLGYLRPILALVGGALVTVVFCTTAVYASQKEELFVVFGLLIFVSALMGVAVSRPKSDAQFAVRRVARWLLTGLVLLGFAHVSLVLFGYLGSFGMLMVLLLPGLLLGWGLTSRYATAAYVISTIGASMRQNLALPMVLETAANGQSSRRARILLRIKKWLVEGYPLSEALRRGYPKCPSHAMAMIAAAERISQVPRAMKAIEQDMVARADEARRLRPVNPFYPVLLFIFLIVVTGGLTMYVFPRFHMVLDEMCEGPLPPATRFLERMTEIGYEFSALLWSGVAFVILVVVPVSIRLRLRPRRPKKPYLISRIADFIKWHLPIFHWFENNYSLVQVAELLRLSLAAGFTVNDSIANTLGLDMNERFKARTRKWLKRVEAGESISAAARQSKLPESLAWTFEQQNADGVLSVLETVESFCRSNYSYRVNLARFILWPCVSVVMGAVVGFVVYAVFSPIVMLVNHLAGSFIP